MKCLRLVFLQQLLVYMCVCVCLCMFLVLIQDTGLNAHPWMEIYDDSLIKYMAPLEMHDEFFVPEAVAAASDIPATAAADDGDS